MLTAIVRPPTDALARCELTYLDREPIDAALALQQHAAYVSCLRALGVEVVALPPEANLPDATFVEDAAIVLDEVAVITRPGAASRLPEVPSVADALRPYRPLLAITAPGTLDGGDVLHIDRDLYVGTGGRSNVEGIAQLRDLLAPHGYRVHAVAVTGCLHLKSAVTYLGDGLLLANPAWLDLAPLARYDLLPVAPEEPFAANTLRLGDTLLHPAGFPRTTDLLAKRNVTLRTLDISEMQKAEAALTCLSLPFTIA
jgi:dimethylargininase